MYQTHIPTSCFQKLLLGVGSGAIALLRPQRGDMVATFGEVTANLAMPSILKTMQKYEDGRKILQEKPRISCATVNFEQLRRLPDRTLGREYVRFLDKLGSSPNERPPVQFVDNPDYVYVMQRYRETHDLYHTVLDMPTTILGEVVVKWWEGLQLGLPMCVLGGAFGAWRLYPKQRQKYLSELLPWVIASAPRARFFMAVYWEHYWDWPIETLQKELDISSPPKL